ncbi:DUF7716 domain-containing protein [Aureibacillus halotolerans]|uniref:DUF7716 domain-containing protein n=1 Tax=Aureibacillus halotolerans TaxID=1508390 RepID=A0A4R6U236_9BACI|nr:hypothetical protein [Aureibacillus halotolerans]TDQ37164.1 hypothetical protein EV213_11443 [Aureibacillus halotolerans]
MEKLIDLREVLVNVEKFSWEDSLFLPPTETWSLDTNCAILNTDDLDDEEEPRFAIDNNLKDALTIQDVQGVVMNIREQHPECTDDDLLKALLHYYQHDAFIVL